MSIMRMKVSKTGYYWYSNCPSCDIGFPGLMFSTWKAALESTLVHVKAHKEGWA